MLNNNVLSTKKNSNGDTVIAGGRIVNIAQAFIAGLDLGKNGILFLMTSRYFSHGEDEGVHFSEHQFNGRCENEGVSQQLLLSPHKDGMINYRKK